VGVAIADLDWDRPRDLIVLEGSGYAVGAGKHRVTWHPAGRAGERLASGVYFVRLDADGIASSRKFVLVRP
jgi:hypothetical protein